MHNKSRVANSIRNVAFGIGGQFLSVVIGFATRSVFIHFLTVEYLGLNGLFTNILSLLSLAELGIGSAITFSLYKPLAEDNQQKVKSLMHFYAKAYKVIGISIGLLGLMLAPFLDFFLKEKPNIPNLTYIYLLYLAGSVISYFYTYKRSIINASQNQYVDTINFQIFNILKNILQIGILYFTHNFILYLLIQIIITFASNIAISLKADKMFPYLKGNVKVTLDAEERKLIFKNVGALSIHKIAGVAVFGISNLLISKYIGLDWVGIYSNYTLIIISINSFLLQIFNSIIASVGNLHASESKEKSYATFKVVDLLNFWLYGSTSIILLFVINPFIELWIGKKYLLDNLTVLFIILNYFATGRRSSVLTFKIAFGLFWNDRYKPVAETILNVVFSIILLKSIGLIGAFIATLLTTMLTCFWVEPYVTFKNGFDVKVSQYFKKYITYFLAMSSIVLILYGIIYFYQLYSSNDFILRCIISFVIPNLLFWVLFKKTNEFVYLKGIFSRIVPGKNIYFRFQKKIKSCL